MIETPVVNPASDQKISDVAQSQESLQADVLSMQSQLSNLDNNVNNLSTKMSELTQQLETLSQHLNAQSQDLDRYLHPIIEKKIHIKRHKPKHKVVHAPRVKYFVEAIMPRRAWLISESGFTITVRVGSKIPGYGVVRLIDDRQGRVRTSTGAVFVFSQDDS